jgi:hypothetical protein
MKRLGLKTVPISSLRLPGGFAARLKAPHVRELSASLDHTPLLNPPGVRSQDMQIIHGCDRVAACKLAGLKSVEVMLLQCDDEELARARIAENVYRRRDDRDALLAELAALNRGEAERADAANYSSTWGGNTPEGEEAPKRGRGRPKTAKGVARERAAKQAGTTPKAVEAAEYRAKKKAEPHVEPAEPDQPPIEMHGLLMGNAPAAAVAMATSSLAKVDQLLRQAQALVTSLESALANFGPDLYRRYSDRLDTQELRRLISQAAGGVRAARPQSVCVYCKLLPGETDNCPACKGAGYLTADQLRDVPPKLLATGPDAGIFVGGEFVRLSEVR